MKLGLDARMIEHSGIGTYLRGILRHLSSFNQLDLTLFGNLKKIADYPARKIAFSSPIYSIREQIIFPDLLRKHSVQLLHVPHYNVPLAFTGSLIVTVHDLIHLRFPASKLAYFYARTLFQAAVVKARVIIADSYHTQKDLVELIGADKKKIRVIYPGMGTPFSASAQINQPAEGEYVLYAGNVKPTKNIPVLIKAFLLAKEKIKDARLIIAGKNFMPHLKEQYQSYSSVQFMDEVPTNVLAQLYHNAKLFVFPSLYEGFGLPPLEAMACGVPVVCSNAASLPEAVGDAAVLFDPHSVHDLAEIIVDLWNNEQKRKDLIKKGYENVQRFSWERCAQQILQAYEECVQ